MGRGFEPHRGSQGSNYFPYAQTQEKNKELGNSATENEEGSIPSLARNVGLGAQRRSYSDWINMLFADSILEYQSGVRAKRQLGSLWPLSQVVKTPPFHGGGVGSNPAGVTIWLHPLTGLGGRPLKPIMWVRIPLESPFVMTYFYKRNKRCIHREKGRDTEMYPIKLSQTKRLILRCVPYWQILARTLLQE